MKNKTLLILILLFLSFCFIVFFKGLKNSNVYIPETILNKDLAVFSSKNLFTKEQISTDEIFINSEFYIINIWASWCLPCKNEHKFLLQLSKNKSAKLIGLNYKDKRKNAIKFIKELGNPYSMIITDEDGTISIKLGAYGIPETYIVDKNKKIIKKIIGPLNKKLLRDISLIIK
jgi:cytochrome c biogenesis protein CcmG/thiol:disulfide interchange protein DsbE|tara:strand:- start:1882 stop:2403 length:522 start_codon:yes stop_codon:yes gene_type:complete